MTKATLPLQDINEIGGDVETGGDYVRFTASERLDEHQIIGPHEGEIVIDGKAEWVVLTSYRATDEGGCEITLRRIEPNVS